MEKRLSYSNLFKRVLSLALALVMLLGMVPVPHAHAAEGETKLYLKPNSNWLMDGARFAMYYFDGAGSDGWTGMSDSDADGVYEGTVPAGFANVIFCRMNPGAADNNWDNKWNQTSDLKVPTDGTNCYTVADGTWDNGGGAWSKYPSGSDEEEPSEPESSEPESSEPENEDALYIVAGDSALCGSNWDAADINNKMTKTADGTYQKVYTSVAAGTYNLKVTDGTWANSWGDNGQNYTFVVSAACDVTVTFDPTSCTVNVTGENVGRENGLEITAMVAVGNGTGNWLNGASWDVASTANRMTEVSDDVYEITYEDVPAGTGYEFKFAANGSWTHSWGSGGAAGEAAYNGQNIKLAIEYALADVTLRLDMTGYDHASKSGATYSVTVTEAVAEPTVDYYMVGYINGADYYELGSDYKFADGKLTVTFAQDSYVYIKTGDNIDYMFQSYVNTTSGTLYNTSTGANEKMFVPGNVELEFTLVENADDTLTLSYAEAAAEPTVEYYLVGYINGADYYELGSDYKFAEGKLTVTFAQDSYVYIKTGDNTDYMFQSYVDAASGTLYNTSTGANEKMKVPGNVKLVFTLVENGDDTLTLSYAEAADTNDVTLHFFKPETWGTTINGYLWTSSGAVPGYEAYNTWPGKAVEANANHAGWYDLVVSTETPMAFNFIFNDGGNQTADLYTGDVTGDTELWIVGNDVSATAPGEWSGDYDYTANLHFRKPADWADTIHAWIWDANGAIPGYEEYNTAWPGKAVEADAINAGWYNVSVTVDENTGFSFIFNDNNGKQTADLTTGTLEVKTDLWVVDGVVLTEAPAGWVDPNRTVHVPGTFPGPSWDAGSNQMSYDPALGLYVYTFEAVPAANYEYKIAINSSWNENYGVGGVRDGGNIAVSVPETMDVTVYYNDNTHYSVTSVNYIFADVTLTGTGIPEGTKMTDEGLTGIYSVTVPMAAGVYTDLVIHCEGTEYPFDEIEIEEAMDVTFYMDPVTGIYYCDASDMPIDEASIYFDSQNEEYKKPFGAVATGEEVSFSIDTGKDITSAVLVVKGQGSYPMTEMETETGKRWSCTASFAQIGEYDYYFSLSNGSTVAIYSDDDGYYGEGVVTELTKVKAYDLVVYEAGFETPDWMKDAVIYQIFPDRFFDGDVSNNQAQLTARGEVNYEYITNWYTLPENPEQELLLDEATYKATGAHYGDGEWSNEIYGGDLEGIIERIDYLKALGVNVIYLNPIFASISNHRYDACDYTEIDPILGTMGDFKELVAVAEANDMHIILDGVFNHVSDDSIYFDRYYKFLGTSGKIGAYPYWAYVYDYMAANSCDEAAAEAAAKEFFGAEYGITDYSYTEWFEVYNRTSGSVDNIGLRAGKDVYAYDGWWGYDSMPIIYSTNGSEYQTGNWAEEIIYNPNGTSVTQYWISKGNNGWRLDVANEVSDETWKRFRDSVKSLDSDAVIIGEIWDDATKYLKGDMYDSVMNYLFRNAVTSFAMGTGSEKTTKEMEKVRERYPEEAFYAMMNLVGSHDTTRLLSYLDGIGDDRADKSLAAAFPTYAKTSAAAKARQYLVAFLQFTYPGAPTIYYGDEIGMVGADDPDDRRAMEWGKGNKELVEWYARLAAIRDAYPALRTGEIAPIDLENDNLLAFVRSDDANTLTVIANNSTSAQTVALEGTYVDLISGASFTDSVSVPSRSGVILVASKEAKTVKVNNAALAPAYDSSYIVAVRPDGVHVHKYTAEVVEPTCTEDGYTIFTCECGDSYISKEVPALGHDELVEVIAPTCTEAGYSIYTCSRCDYYHVDDYVAALGHTWDEGVLTKEPAEKEPGEITYTCVVCGETYVEKVVIKLADSVSDKLTSGKSMTLKAVDLRSGKTISASKMQWTLTEESAPYASVNASGKLKAHKIGEQVQIEVIGRLKNDASANEIRHTITIYPAATSIVLTKQEVYEGETLYFLVDSTETFDVGYATEDNLPTMSLRAEVWPFDAMQEVSWKSSNTKIAKIDENGVVTPVWNAKTESCKTGTVTITATAKDGSNKKASFKLKVTSLVNTMEIVTKDGKNMGMEDIYGDGTLQPVIYASAGQTLNLKAEVNKNATNKGVTWKCWSNSAKISGSGKLTISKNVPYETWMTVQAQAKDGSNTWADITVIVKPAATNVYLYGNGNYLSNTTKSWNMTPEANKTMRLSARVYPYAAIQEVTWKSSNSKIAKIEQDEFGYYIKFLKAGKVTISAVSNDVSKEKSSFTLKVEKGIESLSVESQTVVGGKSLNLAKLVKINPKDATNKSLKWEILDNEVGATITSKGLLKTKAVDKATVVQVIISVKDGWGASTQICNVTITPKK